MNENINDLPEDIRLNVVQPKEKTMNIVAMSDPVYVQNNVDKNYEGLIQKHIQTINEQNSILERDKRSLALEMEKLMNQKTPITYNGEKVYSLFHSLGNARQQESIQLFNNLVESNNSFFAFDIETFGDSQNRERAYGISEIAINEYNADGSLKKKGLNQLIRQGEDVVSDLQDELNKIKADKYYYNALPEYKKRSIVDLMRYSTYKDSLDQNSFNQKNGIQHHSIIQSVFNHKDAVDHQKIIRNMDYYMKYMESGLKTVSATGVSPHEAMNEVNRLFRNNTDKYFVSYNGNNFDMPVLSAFAAKQGVELSKNVKHLDYLNVIRTAYMNSDDLKRKIDPNYEGSVYGKNKLAAFRELIADETAQSDAHNAIVDTNDTARVVAATKDYVRETVKSNKAILSDDMQLHPSHMTWNDNPLYHGQQLFANSGVQSFQEGDESFRMRWDEESKKYVPTSNGFNKTVINSKTFYQFAGSQDMGDGKLAFRFFDPERNEYSYIVRSGNPKIGSTALQELQKFTQDRFYNWDGADEDTKQQIHHYAETDRARRRYDRYFSLDGGGKGLYFEDGKLVERGTAGYSGLKRMLDNARIMNDHLESNGQIYRDRVTAFRRQGMSESEAKEAARLVTSDELVDKMNFESQFNPKTGKFEFNTREKESFFKMYGRLIDEMPYLNEAINKIDQSFQNEMNSVLQIQDPSKRKERLKEVNQKRDLSIMRYHQEVTNQIGIPKNNRPVQNFESHYLRYFDPESNEYRSLNFESVGSANNSLYNYAKRGVSEDAPNRQGRLRERVDNLLQNLHGQKIIQRDELKTYQNILFSQDSVWDATTEIAATMRNQNGGRYQKQIEEVVMHENKNIQHLSPAINQSFINKAIEDAKNANYMIHMNAVSGKRLELSENLRNHINVLDNQRFSRLNPNNYRALEELVSGIRRADNSAHIALAMDTSSKDANMKVYVYDGINSATVQNQLNKGVIPSQAVELNMPLINESGTHRVGGLVLNAHSMAVRDGDTIRQISSAEHIASGYSNRMYDIMKLRREGKVEEANRLAKRTLNNQIENMSGIQRNMVGANDTYKWADNFSDELKQAHLKVGNAMVEDLFYNGYKDLSLDESDFYDADDVFRRDKQGNLVLKRNVQLSDIQMNKQHEILMNMTDWAKDRMGLDVFTSGLKAEHVAKGVVSLEDMRAIVPYGSFYNHGRDNLIQYMNAYQVNQETKDKLINVKGVSRDRLLETPRYAERGRGNEGINAKIAYMTQDQLREQINKMFETKAGRKILHEAELLTPEGKLDTLKLPRLYEQQGILAHDFVDALSVDNEKRYEKGKQFILNKDLMKNNNILPGQELGVRIHDNGVRESIRYEGNKPAEVIQGISDDGDLLVRWKSDPFKIMFDGEKITDSPVHRRFIEHLTGQDDIVGIINPDVAKHKDFGMLMSGEARILAQHVRNELGENKQRAIDIIENGNLGLKWDPNMNGFKDHSFGKEIKRTAFDDVFSQLGISNTTQKGNYRVGILEGHLAKVANYSKVIDHTGRQVIGMEEHWNPISQRNETVKTYGRRDGVQWGHREMSVLRNQGLNKTYDHVHQIMMEQAQESNRLQESRAVAESLRYLTQEDKINLDGIHTGEFSPLPEEYRNARTYKGTIFDREAVESIVERQILKHGSDAAGVMNQHGFWLNLPSVTGEDGVERGVNVSGDVRSKQEINKIFVPFTNLEGANGDIHLRNLQRQIQNIYEKAEAVSNATSLQDARMAHEELQTAARGYVKQSFEELSSSTGMLFGDAFKTSMGGELNGIKTTSASGLFKLMDYETSKQYGDGEYSVISEDMAKKMGVYDQLIDGKDLYAANVRYPTFHDGAMQFTKLRMDKSIKAGEIHTTSFSSMLQNADSDGDYSHIAVIDDEKIQAEWKAQHDRTRQVFERRWEEHLKKEDASRNDYTPARPVSLPETAPDEHITRSLGNSTEETAAKIGKMTIGRASNLNLYMRQVADRFYGEDPEMKGKILEFGRGLEQKLIDAKHGAEPVGLKMIDHIYSGEWDQAMELDTQKFEGMFQKDFHMKDVAKELPTALQQVRNGLYTQGMKFGTSTGIHSSYGIQNFIDLLYGNADATDFGGDNNALAMWHKYLNGEGANIDRFGDQEASSLESPPTRGMRERASGWRHNLQGMASDMVGGVSSEVTGKVQSLFESIKGMGVKKGAILAGGLAVAGGAGYNILNTEKPEMHYTDQETNNTDYISTQNADIQIQASGSNINRDQLSTSVTQGMQESGMKAGPTRISVNHQDNTQQLNRQWYRDKVRENI